MVKYLEDKSLESIAGGVGTGVIGVNDNNQIVQNLNESNASDKALGAFNTGSATTPGIYILNPYIGDPDNTYSVSGDSFSEFFEPGVNVKAGPDARKTGLTKGVGAPPVTTW
ncbi:MAG: hypothetical protein FJX71_06825 [Alphaproteobacteria bacterium]|nr:hypothetical protein [Alphaproteobacteria bacterium]